MRRNIPEDTQCFHFYDANPKGKITNDCVIRAIALATDQSWDKIFTDLFQLSLKYKQMMNCPEIYDRYLKSLGFVKHPMLRKSDRSRYTGEEFCQLDVCSDQTVIIHIGSHHISCVHKGRIWDTWDCSEYCVGNYWTKP